MTTYIDAILITILSLCAILMGAITILVMVMCYQVAKREKDFTKRIEKGEKEENGNKENL